MSMCIDRNSSWRCSEGYVAAGNSFGDISQAMRAALLQLLCNAQQGLDSITQSEWLQQDLPYGIAEANAVCSKLSDARQKGPLAAKVQQALSQALTVPACGFSRLARCAGGIAWSMELRSALMQHFTGHGVNAHIAAHKSSMSDAAKLVQHVCKQHHTHGTRAPARTPSPPHRPAQQQSKRQTHHGEPHEAPTSEANTRHATSCVLGKRVSPTRQGTAPLRTEDAASMPPERPSQLRRPSVTVTVVPKVPKANPALQRTSESTLVGALGLHAAHVPVQWECSAQS